MRCFIVSQKSFSRCALQPFVSAMLLLLCWIPLALGDGELVFSSSTSVPLVEGITTTATSNVTYAAWLQGGAELSRAEDCNPFLEATQYLRIGNGNGILSTQCGASWDVHEVEVYDENGRKPLELRASQDLIKDNLTE